MDALDRLVGRLCVALVGLACALLFGMMLVICADVFLRNLAVPGMPEVSLWPATCQSLRST